MCAWDIWEVVGEGGEEGFKEILGPCVCYLFHNPGRKVISYLKLSSMKSVVATPKLYLGIT